MYLTSNQQGATYYKKVEVSTPMLRNKELLAGSG